MVAPPADAGTADLPGAAVRLRSITVWSLAPDRAWGGIPALRVYAQPTPTLTFLAQLLPPLGIAISLALMTQFEPVVYAVTAAAVAFGVAVYWGTRRRSRHLEKRS